MSDTETSEARIRQALKAAYRSAERKPPAFDDMWAAAETRQLRSRRRRRAAGGVAAAAALIVITIGLWPGHRAVVSDEFLIADALMNSTSWSAPSDSLMPQHQFDIYQGIPLLDESTISQEGSLL